MREPDARQQHGQTDQGGGKAGAEQLQPRQSQPAMDQEVDRYAVGRNGGQRDPQSGLGPIDRAHEAADRQETQRRRNPPCQAQQVLLRFGARDPRGATP